MKKFTKLLAAMLMLCLLAQFFVPNLFTEQVMADSFADIEKSTVEIRYDKNLGVGSWLKGNGYTPGASVYGDYLIVPAHFSEITDERCNMVVVYDMSHGDPVEVKRWDMSDLGMTLRKQGNQDTVFGITVTDKYLLLAVKIFANNPAANNKGYTTGLYVYENPFRGIELPDNPTRLMTSDPAVALSGCSVLSNKSSWFDATAQGGVTMYMLGDNLITYYGVHSNHYITVTDMSGEYPVSTYIEEENLLKYTVDGAEVSSVKSSDIVFDGDLAYIIASTDSQGSNGYRNFGIFTVDFSTPTVPVVIDLTLFESDLLMEKDLGQSNASLNVTSGYAYVTSYAQRSENLKNARPHLYTLAKNGYGFDFIKEFELGNDMYFIAGAGGLGSVLVIDDILVGMTGIQFHNNAVYLRFNEARDEILEYKKAGTMVSDAKANALANGIIYGSKMIFPLMRTGVYNPSDSNKAVVQIFDLLSKGVEIDEQTKLSNSIVEDIYASFEEPYTVSGINTIHIKGKNTSGSDKNVQVVFGVYQNDKLVKTKTGTEHKFSPNADIDFYEDIDLSEYSDLSDIVLKAFLWEDFSTVKPLTQVCSPPEVGFTFTLDEAASTSAGVYDGDNHLIRTLWSAVRYDAGTYTESWDGKDDYGNFAPDGDYRIDVLSNNVEYNKFVDVIGNTTDCSSWDTNLSSANSITDMAYDPVTDRLYYASGHVEGGYGLRYVDGASLYRNKLMDEYKPNMTAFRVAVDGEKIYWAAEEIQMQDYEGKGYQNFASYIYATDEGANPYTFEYGERQPSKWTNTYTDPNDPSGPYPSAINRHIVAYPAENNRISGLEVQQKGNFLFSAYMDWGKVFVNDKHTGELLYTLEADMPAGIALCGESILWIAEQNADTTYTLKKYNVGSDGKLTYVSSLDYSFEKVLAMGASPSGGLLAVANGGDCDRVYVLDTASGELVTTYGSGESYYDDPAVKDDKICFDSSLFWRDGIQEHTFVEFMSDKELVIGDSMNGRVYKLDISGEAPKILDSILYLRGGYSVSYVRNDITTIFGSDMEYSLDYEKAESYAKSGTPFEDAWRIKNNYFLQRSTKFPEIGGAIASTFDQPTKLSNGKTYFRMNHTAGGQYLYMLDGNEIKETGISVTNQDLHEDGSLWYRTYKGKVCSFWKKEIIGFTLDDIPLYGEPVLLAEITDDSKGLTPYNGNLTYSRVPVTDSGKIIMLRSMGPSFENTLTEKPAFHLGAIDISDGYSNEWDWMASPRTHRNYQGFFPEDGYFDIGNTVAYTTWNPVTYKDNVIFHYRGEGYQGGQANKILHFSDGGLLVGVFGKTFYEYGGQYEVGGSVWSGSVMELQPSNSMCVSMVGVPGNSDVGYIFQNTEGQGGGVHVTRVTGLDSIKVQSSNVTYKNALIKGVKYTCFNAGNLDSAYIDKTGVSNTFDIPCVYENKANHSIRFEGYYRASYTGNTQFGVQTDGIVKLVVDSQAIIEDKTGNCAGFISLEEGQLYKFKLEVAAGEDGISYLDVGYLSGAKYNSLDMRYVYCDQPTQADMHSVNLLEGLPYGQSVDSGEYGWTTESLGGVGDNAVTMKTNNFNYRRDGDNDMSMYLMVKRNWDIRGNEVRVIRSLGDIDSDSYMIDMDVRFTGHIGRHVHIPRKGDNTSVVIDLLDKNDKIIANLYLGGGTHTHTDIYVLSNGEELCHFPKPVQHLTLESVPKMLDVKVNLPQNLKFYLEDGKVAVEYMGNKLLTTPVDADADITGPARVRFARYNEFATGAYSTTIDVTRFMLYR